LTGGSTFGQFNGSFAYKEIICSGQESNLDECNHLESSPCDSDNHSAGVICAVESSKGMETLMTTETPMTSETPLTTKTPLTTGTPITTETLFTTDSILPIDPTKLPISTAYPTTLVTQPTTTRPYSPGKTIK
jgi:hypothetical protein